MLNFEKFPKNKIISLLVAGAMFLNSTVYGADLPKREHLRVPLTAAEKDIKEALSNDKVTSFEGMFEYLKENDVKIRVVVPVADSMKVLEAINELMGELDASKMHAILVGDENKIKDIIYKQDLSNMHLKKDDIKKNVEIKNVPDDGDALKVAIGCVSNGEAEIILKARVNSHNLMKAILNKAYGLDMKGKVISHGRLIEWQGGRLLLITDGGINAIMDIKDPAKRGRIEKGIYDNAIEIMKLTGVEKPLVFCVGSGENMVGLEEALDKGADVIVVPWIGPGNIIYKAITDTPWRIEYVKEFSVKEGKISIFRKLNDSEILMVATPNKESDFKLKKALLDKALKKAKEYGIKLPNVALLDFTEQEEFKDVVSSIGDSVRLRDDFADSKSCNVEGPMGLDMAVSQAAARAKGYKGEGEVPGNVDILFTPDFVSGEMLVKLYKNWRKWGMPRKGADTSFGGPAYVSIYPRSASLGHILNSIIAISYLNEIQKKQKRVLNRACNCDI